MHRESSPQSDPSTDPSSSSTTAPPATNRNHARRRPASWTLAALGGLVALGLVFVWLGSREQTLTLKYGEFKKRLVAGDVARVTVGRQELIGTLKPIGDGHAIPFRAALLGAESSDRLENLLETYLPDGSYEGQEGPSAILEFLVPTLSIVILIAAIFYIQSRGGGLGSAMAFVRSRHKVYDKPDRRITFADVAGNEEAVAELSEVVEFLKTPGKFQALGGRLPKGVLLVGPPGTGKTLLAKAVAGEAGVPFFSLSGSDFVEMFVGVGAARVRSLFAQAEAKAPCLIFIDELDAIGKARGSGGTGNHDERDQTLNQLLVAMDGFDSNLGVIVMAATNRPETLDAALVRPGRFDRNVVVDRPDLSGREQILKVHTRSMALEDELNLRHIAAMTSGFVGADLANLVNEAALLAARKNKDRVGRVEFEEGVERVIAGPEKRQRVLREDEKERIAYHEAGHAIVSRCLPETDPVHKVSILGRGNGTLGYTMYRPEDDRFLHTRTWLLNCIASLLGGTLAEEIVYGEWSDGATSDLQRATQIARKMVAEFGMSTRLGRVSYQGEGRSPFLAGGGANSDGWSEQTAREIDEEVRMVLAEAQAVATDVLTRKRHVLEEVTRLLMVQETIDASELQEILDRS